VAALHRAERGSLVMSVRERGEVEAAKDAKVVSQLEGRATLIHLIDEGTMVEPGQKVAELDASALVAERSNMSILVARADAALQQARKNFEIMEQELSAAENTALNRLKIARMRVEKFLGQAPDPESAAAESSAIPAAGPDETEPCGTENGDPLAGGSAKGGAGASAGPHAPQNPTPGTNREVLQKLSDLLRTASADDPTVGPRYGEIVGKVRQLLRSEENLDREMGDMANQVLQQIDKISLASADLKLALDTVGHSRNLAQRNFITGNELEKDEISYRRQLSNVSIAWNTLQLLVKYTLPETLIELEQEEANAFLGLASVRAAGEGRRVREAAELEAAKAEAELARERLDNCEQQIANAVLYAPSTGLAIYGRYDWDEPVYEGMEVRERQEIIILPDIRTMVAKLKVHEAQIGQVAVGQTATVKVDAHAGQSFLGKVSYVSALPASTRRRDLKQFEVTVQLDLDNSSGLLRPGMNATVEIDIGVLDDVLRIPLAAIHRRGEAHYVFVEGEAGPEPRQVRLGSNNLTHVEVLHGLTEGERVHLSTPASAVLPDGEASDDSDSEAGAGAGAGAGEGR